MKLDKLKIGINNIWEKKEKRINKLKARYQYNYGNNKKS